jgi:hypothetical protein
MDDALFSTLIRKSESDTLDFKAQQYSFVGGSEEEKGELLKDILAFANASKETDAYILVGVKEKNRRAYEFPGITTHLADNDLQEFINKKTNRPVAFSVEAVTFKGVDLDIIRINRSQAPPIFLRRNFGRLKNGEVYIRRGSSTAVADADEIAEMGKTAVSVIPLVRTSFEMIAFAKRGDSQKTGLIGRVYLQLKNSGDRSAHHINAVIKHDDPGCLAGGPTQDWDHSDQRLNPWVLRYRHSLHPEQSAVIMAILLCERSPFPFKISAELSADDCSPVIFCGAISAEQVANEKPVVLEKKS